MSAPVLGRATRQRVALLLVTVAAITVLYWILWFADRPLLASETTPAYYQFENAFPLADGWWVLGPVAGAWTLVKGSSAAMATLLEAGGAGLYLFCMDVLYDAEHGIWSRGAGGAIEAVINLATLLINAGLITFTWRNRAALVTG